MVTSDLDTCTVYWPPCSFSNNTAHNRVVVKEWHADVGGTFGRLDEKGNFVPEGDPTKVTHYKPPKDYTGYVSITVEIDDIPKAVDPATGQEVDTWNDEPPAVSDPAKLTVWEFEIDPPFIDALPQDGATYTFTATIRPEKDHYGQSMARFIVFEIYSSREPGYCLNASREQGLWTDTSPEDNDLKFVPNQQGFQIENDVDLPIEPYLGYGWAVTVNPVLTASVQVRCLDYGAYGSIWALADLPGQEPFAAARWKGTFVERGALIPLDQRDGLDNDGDSELDEDLIDGQDNDNDGEIDEDAERNLIYDGWQWNNGAAMDDNDNEPQGDGTRGDGLTRYEEYRGLLVLGEANDGNRAQVLHYIRLNPVRKEIFVSVSEIPHAGYFPGSGMPTTYLLDFNNLPDQESHIVNFHSTMRIRPVFSIRVYRRIVAGGTAEPIWHGQILYGYCTQPIWSGQRQFDPFGVPGTGPMAVIHTAQIQRDCDDYGSASRYVVGHEIGHSVLWHQPNNGHHDPGPDFCLMPIPIRTSSPYPSEFCGILNVNQDPGCQFRWRLNPP